MLRKRYGGLSLWMVLVSLTLIFLAIIIGSFVDLPLAEGIYIGKNWLSEFGEYTGTVPITMILASSGMFLFFYFRKESQNARKNFWAFFFLILVWLIVGGFWGFDTFHRHLKGRAYLWFLIGYGFITLVMVFWYFLLRKGESKDYLKKALVIIISGVAVMILTFGIKFAVVRPRYMFLRQWEASGEIAAIEDYYVPWYTFNHDKSLFKGLSGYESYAIQSWPSGHSSFCAMLILMVLYPSCFKDGKKKEWWFYLIGVLYAIVIMLSRMLDGHHFLSDIGFGALFGFLPCALTLLIMYRKEAKNG